MTCSRSDDIQFEQQGAIGLATLTRPRALNALTREMCRALDEQLVAWERDSSVRAVVVRGAGERAFCAGGDVRKIYEAARAGEPLSAVGFFRDEYVLIRRLHRLSKPYLALADGITMGGGAGISVNGRFCVVTERTLFAMPEVLIGSFPDVGATRFLRACPGKLGLFLALTAARVEAADVLACGLATHFVPHAEIPALTAALAAGDWSGDDPGALLSRFAGDAGPSQLLRDRPAIDRVFSGDSVEAIVAALAHEPGDWAAAAREALDRASPLALKITFHQLQQPVDLEGALALEYRIMEHLVQGGEFPEGVRALLVDKDRAPRWRPLHLAEVDEAAVLRHFASLGPRELSF